MGSATTSTQCLTSHHTPHMSRQPPFDIRRSDASDPPLSCLAAEGRSARERHHVSLLPSPGAHPPPAPSACSEPLAIDIRSHTSLHTHTQRAEGAASSIAGLD